MTFILKDLCDNSVSAIIETKLDRDVIQDKIHEIKQIEDYDCFMLEEMLENLEDTTISWITGTEFLYW